jgi:hypothetical protein
MKVLRRPLVGAVVVAVALALPMILIAAETVDQQVTGPFDFGYGQNAAGGIAQGFTPTADNLTAVDIFMTGTGVNPALNIPVEIRDGAFDGPVVGSGIMSVPANLNAPFWNPAVIHVVMSPTSLTPGSQYYIHLDPDGGLGLGPAAVNADVYPGGSAYQGDFNTYWVDWGFRTYFDTGIGPPTSKDQCKNGGWATFDTPRAFKNQGDCIQFVNTGK